MKITFLTVVYNNLVDTKDFLESLSRISKDRLDVDCILIDNSDIPYFYNEIKRLTGNYSFSKVISPSANLGYFGAFNYYFNLDYTPSDVVILCNNDLIFDVNFLDNFKNQSYHDDVFVVCPDVVTVDGVHQNPHVLKPRSSLQRLKLDLYFSHFYLACLLRYLQTIQNLIVKPIKKEHVKTPCYLHMGIGACYVLLPAFLSRFKNLDFPHFLYGEEAYLSRQVHGGGGKLFYDPSLRVVHKESATLSKLPSRVTYEYGRAGYYDYRKFY